MSGTPQAGENSQLNKRVEFETEAAAQEAKISGRED